MQREWEAEREEWDRALKAKQQEAARASEEAAERARRLERMAQEFAEKETAWGRSLSTMRRDMETAVEASREAQREYKEETLQAVSAKCREKVERAREKMRAMKLEWGDIHAQMARELLQLRQENQRMQLERRVGDRELE